MEGTGVFYLGRFKFEVPIIYPSGDVTWAFENTRAGTQEMGGGDNGLEYIKQNIDGF